MTWIDMIPLTVVLMLIAFQGGYMAGYRKRHKEWKEDSKP